MQYIYKTTNLINGKTYVGQYTDLSNSFETYLGGGKLIRAAIKKYGKQNFKKEIILQGTFKREFLDELERHYIQLYSPAETPNSYNLDKGGNSSNKSCKKVYQYSLDGKFITEYNSPAEAAKSVNTTATAMRNILQKGISSKGFIWTYDTNDISNKIIKVKESSNLMSTSRAKEKVCVYCNNEWHIYNSCVQASKKLNISIASISTIISSKIKCGWIKSYFISNQIFENLPERTFNTVKYNAVNNVTNKVYNTAMLFSISENLPLSTANKYLKQGNDFIINNSNITFIECFN